MRPRERLKQLTADEFERTSSLHLTCGGISALMERHDTLVAHLEQPISQKGEHSVLY